MTAESDRQDEGNRPTEQGHRKTSSHEHGAKVKRVASVRVRAGDSEFAILFNVAGCIRAQPESRQHERQAPGQRGWLGCAPPKFKEIENGREKSQRHSNAAGHLLPPGYPIHPWSGGIRCGGLTGVPGGFHQAVSSTSSSPAASNTSPGLMVSNPASGSGLRVWSRRLWGLRNTLNRVPKGPFLLGSVGP